VLIHSNGDDEAIVHDGEALEALAALRRSGAIRSFGLSAKTVAGARAALGRVDVLMVTLAPDDPDERALARDAGRQGCGILVKKALASGHAPDPTEALARIGACDGVSSVVIGTLDAAHLVADAEALAPVGET
jgi:aryl-alcohol dehydrogenase-like predicted oxidoreductase